MQQIKNRRSNEIEKSLNFFFLRYKHRVWTAMATNINQIELVRLKFTT